VRRCLRTIRPALVIILETEIWPNLYNESRRAGAGLAIVNGRISHRAWPRYRRWCWFFHPVLQLPDIIFPQSAIDRERYLELGVPPARLGTNTNLKYDAALSTSPSALRDGNFGASHIWIAASTVGPNERGSLHKHGVDEDDLVIAAFQQLAAEFPRFLLILAPRQPARFEEVARKLQAAGINFVRRSAIDPDRNSPLTLPGVLLLDTMGELASLYASANVVFVGGSIAPRGGHNIIEPASAAAAIVIGPHMHNFEAIAQDFLEANAVVQLKKPDELLPAIRYLLIDNVRAKQLGQRAQQVVALRRGGVDTVARRLWRVYFSNTPRPVHSLIGSSILYALACFWIWGGAWKRRSAEQYAYAVRPLTVPVISIGAITIGGAGKTPFTNYLATRLCERGHSPAILTRGYRRRSPAEYIILPPGASIPAAFTGDEAQIFLRAAEAPLGIGANRYQCAQVLLRQFPGTDALLLDDGFQHARLLRSLNIVLIDGLDPFGQENVVPLGRLREPLEALARAHVFVVTRAENDLRYDAIASRLAQLNPHAAVFRTRLVERSWRNLEGACVLSPAGRRVAAFCGLGNPDNFWRTLESLGVEVVFQWSFGDHHAYKQDELRRIAHQALLHDAEILVTTEKDWINCPPQTKKAIAPFDLAWVEVEMQLEEEERFLRVVETVLGSREAAGLAS
jgi:tetraacyldisaccharide 4'-kinase